MKGLLVAAFALGAFVIAMSVTFAHEKSQALQGRQIQVGVASGAAGGGGSSQGGASSRSGGADTGAAYVPNSRIPTDFSQAQDAATLALLPDHWSQDPNPNASKGVGAAGDQAAIPANVRSQIASVVAAFLGQWESFTANNPQLGGEKASADDYRYRISPYVSSDALPDVASRADNRQPPEICPSGPQCTVGSFFSGSDVPDAMVVRAYDGQNAWVTVKGTVTYTGDPNNPLVGGRWLRDYSLLLSQQNGQWLIVRAAADTVGPA